MGLIDSSESGLAAAPTMSNVMRGRLRPPRFAMELEGEIRQLYLRMLDEPVPARLIGILRAGLAGHKS